jgi:Tfp pilus assembly protein PilV
MKNLISMLCLLVFSLGAVNLHLGTIRTLQESNLQANKIILEQIADLKLNIKVNCAMLDILASETKKNTIYQLPPNASEVPFVSIGTKTYDMTIMGGASNVLYQSTQSQQLTHTK